MKLAEIEKASVEDRGSPPRRKGANRGVEVLEHRVWAFAQATLKHFGKEDVEGLNLECADAVEWLKVSQIRAAAAVREAVDDLLAVSSQSS